MNLHVPTGFGDIVVLSSMTLEVSAHAVSFSRGNMSHLKLEHSPMRRHRQGSRVGAGHLYHFSVGRLQELRPQSQVVFPNCVH